jgi:acetylornithine/LysW-gamma-L-lysine aminotransferase
LPARVRDVRQIGLMIGIELKEKATPYLQALLQRRVLALPAGPTVIRLLPPLVISESQLDTVVDALHNVLSD